MGGPPWLAAPPWREKRRPARLADPAADHGPRRPAARAPPHRSRTLVSLVCADGANQSEENDMNADQAPPAGGLGTRHRLPQGAASGSPLRARPGTGGRGAWQIAERYRRVVEPAVRGIAGGAASVAVFAPADAVGGPAGGAIASAWVAGAGTYCLANFWHCRGTHCAVTGPGWA